jgi:hypothetical protein
VRVQCEAVVRRMGIRAFVRGAGPALCLLPLLACGHREDQSRKLALDGALEMREAFNSGACQSIYEHADGPFRYLQSREVWLSRCVEMRAELGEWRSFEVPAQSRKTGTPVVALEGPAVFANREIRLRALWRVDRGRAHLLMLVLIYADKTRRIPDVYSRPPMIRMVDPPPGRDWERV